ncbi:hypothetical protein MJO28_008421 [Puccinia striiformis f. sp. tritici]|uniref:Uncharacterized protein n=1 Tax=Puccinia striiformis f. sp. tritici TaxID=168172 RepID=A0ACC0EDT9_9BASI|nr:hypothetical protein MJO28_008421 [Puccinia striiformis f. sp. tritici]
MISNELHNRLNLSHRCICKVHPRQDLDKRAEYMALLAHYDPQISNGAESGKKEGGDLTIAVPRFRIKGSDPKQLAQKIQDEIQPAKAEGSLVKFEMDSQTLCRTVSHQVNELPHLSAKEIGGGCGINSSGINPSTGKKKKFALEFSSPNIAKRIMQVILEVLS